MLRPRIAAALGALLYCALAIAAGRDRQRTHAPDSSVESFTANNVPVLDALLKLGRQQHIALGIDYVDLAAAERPISVSLEHVTVARALDAILAHQRGYVWGLGDGVVVVSQQGAPAGARNLLDFVLPSFSVRRCTLQEASHALEMDLGVALHPQTKGIVGDYRPGNTSTMVGPLHLHAITVRQVLDRLVLDAGVAAWMAQVPPADIHELPSRGLWRLIDFTDPASLREVDHLRQSLRGYESARGRS
ncbi:MAG TPA: hypothetical protein VL523_06795 [Terriglobia bacterium]|nr:hypothetical protein [Terriglobia bacterium]